MSEVLVNIQNVSKVFPKAPLPALQDINAIIPQGEIVGLVGPDGAGKTTLIRLIAGLLKPTQGTITVAGCDTIKDAENVHYLTGYMPQKFGLYEDLTVMQNLDLYADLRGVLGDERKATMERLLKFTGLSPFTERLAKNLSGGMKQKLGLACALIKKPTLLLLDEPSVGVDPISRRELWKMVHELLEQGVSILWSTAYLDEAERCRTVILINGGKLLYHGNPKILTDKVAGRVFKITHIEGSRRQLLTEVLRQKNVLDGTIQGQDVRVVVRDSNLPIEMGGLKGTLEPTAPRFEDAFLDILGGIPGGESELAKMAPRVPETSEMVVVSDHLTKKFGAFTAADQIDFQVPRGEIFGLFGPNGAGKSTIFKMLCGLLTPTEGKPQ